MERRKKQFALSLIFIYFGSFKAMLYSESEQQAAVLKIHCLRLTNWLAFFVVYRNFHFSKWRIMLVLRANPSTTTKVFNAKNWNIFKHYLLIKCFSWKNSRSIINRFSWIDSSENVCVSRSLSLHLYMNGINHFIGAKIDGVKHCSTEMSLTHYGREKKPFETVWSSFFSTSISRFI